jgi:hypothetical protein
MAESEKKRLAGAATKTVEPKATVKPKAKPTPPIVEALVKAGAVGAALFARHKGGGPAHLPKTDKPKKKVKTKGSGRSTTKFARTGGSGGAAGAGLGRGGISPRKFNSGGLVGSPRRKKFI